MKSKLILMCAVAAISLSLFACSPASEEVAVETTCDDFMENQHISQEVEVAVDDSLTVTLGSNPTTGFQWSEAAQISDQTLLEQLEHEFVPPEATGVAGASGQEVWTFKALKKGTSTISMDYSRSWEDGETAEWTFVLTVVVK